MSARGTNFRVGLFVTVALLIGGVLAFAIGNQRSLFSSKTEYTAVFDNVSGLRPGSPVRIGGVDVGTVASVELADNGRIEVVFGVVDDATSLVREGSIATIGNKGLLGDKLIEVTVGEGEPLPAGATIPSEASPELTSYLAEAGRILGDVQGTVENLRLATEPLGDAEFGEDIRDVAHNLSLLTKMATSEDGTVGRLLADRELADRFERTLQNTETMTAELSQSARNVRLVLDEVRAGDGTAHELIYGTEGRRLITNLADTTGEASQILAEVRTGDGMLHGLVYEDTGAELMTNLTDASGSLRDVLGDIRDGRGTLGALIADPSIYEDIKRLIGDLQRNEILRALVRYSIRRDESQGDVDVRSEEAPADEPAPPPAERTPPPDEPASAP
jgi:phospholipid/cholesterol/gamma-HCH transport system substrate-binding protein